MKITKKQLKLKNRKRLIILAAGIYQLLIFAGLWTAAEALFKQNIPHHEDQTQTENTSETEDELEQEDSEADADNKEPTVQEVELIDWGEQFGMQATGDEYELDDIMDITLPEGCSVSGFRSYQYSWHNEAGEKIGDIGTEIEIQTNAGIRIRIDLSNYYGNDLSKKDNYGVGVGSAPTVMFDKIGEINKEPIYRATPLSELKIDACPSSNGCDWENFDPSCCGVDPFWGISGDLEPYSHIYSQCDNIDLCLEMWWNRKDTLGYDYKIGSVDAVHIMYFYEKSAFPDDNFDGYPSDKLKAAQKLADGILDSITLEDTWALSE